MQDLITILLCFHLALLNAQTEIIDTTQVKNDTIFYEKKVYSDNGKICEMRYYRALKYPSHYTKEDLFIRGISPFLGTDSIRQYSYDLNWILTDTNLIKDSEAISDYAYYTYSPEEFQLTEKVINITGRTNEERKVAIDIQNVTAQDFFIEIRRKGEVTLAQEPSLMKNRSTSTIDYDVKFVSGFKEVLLNLKNSNGKTQDLKVKMIGYDLSQADFVSKKDLKKRKPIEFKLGKEIFMDVSGNTKLLNIKNKKLELNITTSKLINKLDGDLLPEGNYVFILHNLGAAEKKYCRVKVR